MAGTDPMWPSEPPPPRLAPEPPPLHQPNLAPVAEAPRTSRRRLWRILWLVTTAALLASTVVLAVMLVRTNSSLKSTQEALSTTQINLKVAQADLKKTQASLSQTQGDLHASTAVSEYASMVVDGTSRIVNATPDVCVTSSGTNAQCATALAKQTTAVDSFKARLAGLTVPPPLMTADSQFRQAIDLLSTALPKMTTANAASNVPGYNAGVDIANQGLDHLNQGLIAVVAALAGSTRAA